MQLDSQTLPLLREALEKLEEAFRGLPTVTHPDESSRLRAVLTTVAERLQDNYPYFHPLYAGQMLKPPHAIARLAYMLSLWINPNNHALDGGRASSAMEKEAVAEIAAMFGWSTHLGHLTGGGTMANLEGLWAAGRLTAGAMVVASDQAHYTHQRVSAVLQLPFIEVQSDEKARMDVQDLNRILERGNVGTVVVTLGTTGTGSVDPLPEILELQKRYGFRIHADAAYGGYFALADNLQAHTSVHSKRCRASTPSPSIRTSMDSNRMVAGASCSGILPSARCTATIPLTPTSRQRSSISGRSALSALAPVRRP